MNGLRGSNLQDNEIVKASDVQMISDGGFENLGKTIKTLFGASKSVIIGGQISAYAGSSLMAKMSPIMGVHGSNEDLFIDHEGKFYYEDQEDPSEIITFTVAGTSARRDIIEVKAEKITAVELSRQFYDPESDSSAYSQTDIETRQILRLKVKKGTNGSDTAPAVDTGYVKIAEVVIPANAKSLSDSNIFNVTADIDGVDNTGWTNDKQSTVNPGTIQNIKNKFRQIHNTDGSLKDNAIAAAKLILSGTGALQGSAIQKGGSALTIDGEEHAATKSIAAFFTAIVARLNKTWGVANGGTGATTVAAARNNLGLGNTDGALPIANGGTGATTAAAARNNLGLGNTDGALPIANGGTGATTANNAWNALAGSASSATGEFTDNTEFITSNANGYSDTDKTFYRRKASLMKSWIRGLFTNGTGTSYNSTTGAFSVSYGNAANTACQGNDSRLSNSRTPTSHASTGTSYGVSSDTNYGHAKASATTPKANGTAAVGTETGTFARGDHVHPTDSTRAPNDHSSTATTYGVSSSTKYGHAMATSTTPKANSGTGNVGTETAKFARGDHVHPETYSVPVGFTYFQLPGEKAPSELFPNTYTWLDITAHFEGLFFRAAGGNAKAFDTCNYEVQTTNATSVILKTTPSGISVGDTVICYNKDDESKTVTRKVKTISESTIIFDNSIASANYTNVLIAQRDTLQGHKHEVFSVNSAQNKYVVLGGGQTGFGASNAGSQPFTQMGGMDSLSGYGTVRYSDETRPQNTSIKIWKRTA